MSAIAGRGSMFPPLLVSTSHRWCWVIPSLSYLLLPPSTPPLIFLTLLLPPLPPPLPHAPRLSLLRYASPPLHHQPLAQLPVELAFSSHTSSLYRESIYLDLRNSCSRVFRFYLFYGTRVSAVFRFSLFYGTRF